jgi:hypothetical protein
MTKKKSWIVLSKAPGELEAQGREVNKLTKLLWVTRQEIKMRMCTSGGGEENAFYE